MIDHYVSCEECLYQEYCHQFDAFFGCINGKIKTDESKNEDENYTLLNNKIITEDNR